MSGGSFNYLCHKDLFDIAYGVGEEWDWMLDELDRLAPDIAQDMRMIRESTIDFVALHQKSWDRLTDVLHAVEWWRSNDWGKEQVEEVIAEYRSNNG